MRAWLNPRLKNAFELCMCSWRWKKLIILVATRDINLNLQQVSVSQEAAITKLLHHKLVYQLNFQSPYQLLWTHHEYLPTMSAVIQWHTGSRQTDVSKAQTNWQTTSRKMDWQLEHRHRQADRLYAGSRLVQLNSWLVWFWPQLCRKLPLS